MSHGTDDPLDEFTAETGADEVAAAHVEAPLQEFAVEAPELIVDDFSSSQPSEPATFRARTHRVERWAVVTVAIGVAALVSVTWFVSSGRTAAPGLHQQTIARPVKPAAPSQQKPSTASNSEAQTARRPAAIEPTARQRLPVAVDKTGAKTVGLTELLPDAAFSPTFAADAADMFFHSGSGRGSAIMRAETDDSGDVIGVASLVRDEAGNFHARPSPDGQWLAFDSDRDGDRGIYVADANGENARRVSGPGFASVPSWSPDGRRIAFVRSEPKRPRVWNIWMLDLTSGESRRITFHRYGQPWGATWFPDGNRIAYSHENRLIIRTLDGKNVRTFNSPIRGRLLRTPAVSPDGKRIIFQVRRDGAWMLDVATGAMSRVLKDPSAEEFTWSPDGTRVAFHSHRSGTWGVWVMAARGA